MKKRVVTFSQPRFLLKQKRLKGKKIPLPSQLFLLDGTKRKATPTSKNIHLIHPMTDCLNCKAKLPHSRALKKLLHLIKYPVSPMNNLHPISSLNIKPLPTRRLSEILLNKLQKLQHRNQKKKIQRIQRIKKALKMGSTR